MNVFLITISLIGFNLAISDAQDKYLNEWTIHIPRGKRAAEQFALEHKLLNLGEVIPDSNMFHMKLSSLRSKRSVDPSHHIHKKIVSHPDVQEAEQLVEKIRTKRDIHSPNINLNDPYWDKMWYLNRGDQLDMNVQGAWDLGVTGQGIAVTILDDGIEKDHPDLIRNYDPLASTDINDNDSDPHPRYDFSDSNRHGTRCAGQVRMDF